MKAKTLAVSIAVLLFMSVAANSRECGKESGPWFEAGNGEGCFPYGVGQVTIGQTNVYKDAGVYRRCCVPEMAQALRMAEILEVTGRAYLRLNKNPVVTP